MAYVKLEDVLNIIKEQNCNNTGIIQHIKQHCPTADVEEVKHGEWEESDIYICNSDGKPIAKVDTVYVCSECGREESRKEPYCHCGAKMDGKDINVPTK